MITAVTPARSCPSIRISWSSHTIYSSAVRRSSVAMRQRASNSASSKRANLALVLPTSIASSILIPLHYRAAQFDIARVNQHGLSALAAQTQHAISGAADQQPDPPLFGIGRAPVWG